MTTEIERVEFGTPEHLERRRAMIAENSPRIARHRVAEEAQSLGELERLCSLLAKAGDLLPRQYRAGVPSAGKGSPLRTEEQTVARLMVVGLAGQSFDWDVMTSVRMFDFIDGMPKLKTETVLGLVQRAGHFIQLSRESGSSAFCQARRADTGNTMEATWTRARAEATPFSEWVNGERRQSTLWAKWGQQGNQDYMLSWRAVSEVARFLFADLTLGLVADLDDLDRPAGAVAEFVPAAPAERIAGALAAKAAELGVAGPEVHELSFEELDAEATRALDAMVAADAAAAEGWLPDMPQDVDGWSELAAQHGRKLVHLVQDFGSRGVKKWADVLELDQAVQGEVLAWICGGTQP